MVGTLCGVWTDRYRELASISGFSLGFWCGDGDGDGILVVVVFGLFVSWSRLCMVYWSGWGSWWGEERRWVAVFAVACGVLDSER